MNWRGRVRRREWQSRPRAPLPVAQVYCVDQTSVGLRIVKVGSAAAFGSHPQNKKSARQNSAMKAERGETGLLAGRSVRGSVGSGVENIADRRGGWLRPHEALRVLHDRREQIDLRVECFAES